MDQCSAVQYLIHQKTSTECHVTSLPLMSGVALMAVGAQPMKTCLV
jgi:hypothetical protein